MKIISFKLFVVNMVVLLAAYFFASMRIGNDFQILASIIYVSVSTSLAGVIIGAIKLRKVSGIYAWSGVIGNTLILIMFAYFVVKGKERVQQSKLLGYDPSSVIKNVSVNHDTLNSGEEYEVTISSDSSYYNRFGEYPQLKVNDHAYHALLPSNSSLLLHSLVDTVEGAAIKKSLKLKLKLKKTPEMDTVLHYDKTYFVTNLESSPRSEGKLINSRKEGLWRFWYDNDRKQLKEETNYHEGKMHGKRTLYWENGNVLRIYTYKEGLLDGMSYWFSAAGDLHDSLLYKNNQEARITER